MNPKPALLALLLLSATGCSYWSELPIEGATLARELTARGPGIFLWWHADRRKTLIVHGEERLVIYVQRVEWPHAYYYDRRARQERSVDLRTASRIYVRKQVKIPVIVNVLGRVAVTFLIFALAGFAA